MLTHVCERCGRTREISDSVVRFICRCGNANETTEDSAVLARVAICNGCKFRVAKGCALFMRPCTLHRLWADQIEPPEQCPNRERFE